MRRKFPVSFSVLLLLNLCFAKDNIATEGSIRGEVVTRNQNGEPAVFPNARIVLHGPINAEAQSDASGAFAIDGLPPGTYEVEASAPGLNATVAVKVKPGTAVVGPIELVVIAVTGTVTVAANHPPAIEESAQKNTVSEPSDRVNAGVRSTAAGHFLGGDWRAMHDRVGQTKEGKHSGRNQ